MHQDDPELVHDPETGLRILRWNLRGFLGLRAQEILCRNGEYELIDGLILHREDGSPRHDAVVIDLARRLLEYYGSRPVSVQRDVELLLDDQDVAVTADLVVFDGSDEIPRLVVEVSEHNSRLDAIEKERIYARAGVEEYWQLDLAWSLMYVHCSPGMHGYGCRSMSPKTMAAMTEVALEGELVFADLLTAAGAT